MFRESANPIRWPLSHTRALAMTASAAGESQVVQPEGGRAVGLQYICLSADGANTADVTVGVRFGVGGSDIYRVNLKPGAIWARNIGARTNWLAGGVDEPLLVNLSAGQVVHVSVEVEEV